MSDVEDDNEIGQQLQGSNDKSKEITAAIQAINLEPKEKQRDPKSKAHADTPRMENMAKQIELIQSALQQQPYSMTQAMKEAQEVMEQVWAERDSFKKVAVKQKDLDYCMQEMVMTKRDAEILLGMASGDLEGAIELFVGLAWSHRFKASDVK